MSTSARGFSVAHQRIAVDVDIRRKMLRGWTELTIMPTTLELSQIVLDARRMRIEKCFVNGIETTFEHFDLLSHPPSRPRTWDAHNYLLYRKKLAPLFKETGEGPGELAVHMPGSVVITEPDESTFIASHTTKEKTYEPLTLRISYHLLESENEGLNFVDTLGKEAHLYTTHTPLGQATSCWVPCVDGLWSLSTWEMEFAVPKLLNEADPDTELVVVCNNATPNEEPDPSDDTKKIVKFEVFSPVSSQHVGFAVGPFKHIALTSGEEKNGERPLANDAREATKSSGNESQNLPIAAFCLPSKASMVPNCCRTITRAVDYFLRDFGLFPYGSYSLCFVADFPSNPPVVDACALTLCSDKLLFPADVIEPLFSDPEILVRAIAAQWCGVNIVPQKWSDLWVTEGIALFMTQLFIKRLMGNNEYRFRIRKANDEMCRQDVGRPPIGAPKFRFPLCADDLAFIRLKAPLVLFILDRRMTKTDRSLGISRVLTKLFLQSMSGDLHSQLSASHFQRQCEKVTHHRLVKFFDEWVYSPGYPVFRVTQRFNKKRMFIEMGIGQVHSRELPEEVLQNDTFLDRAITHLNLQNSDAQRSLDSNFSEHDKTSTAKQESPTRASFSATGADMEATDDATHEENLRLLGEIAGNGDPVRSEEQEHSMLSDFRAPPCFTGPMTIRIHEADGTPYEHVVDLRETFTKLDIQYNTKYKRLRRTQKFRKAASGSGGSDEKFINCLGDVLMSESEVAEWRLTDWGDGEEDESMFNEAFEWVRVDADSEWIGRFFVGQPDYMYASQLQQDRDVVAQYESVLFYGRQQPNPIYSSILTRTLMDSRYYYGVRVAAAFHLAKSAVPQLDYLGKFHLTKVFQELFCFQDSLLPRANHFEDFANYFVQKAIPLALSTIRDQATGKCPRDVCSFLLGLVRYNENSENEYSDSFYIAALMEAVANTLRPVNNDNGDFLVFGAPDADDFENPKSRQFVADVIGEIDKCQRLDRWLPSRNSVVTTTALRMDELLICAGYGEPRMDKLLLATQPDSASEIRVAAVQSLLDLGAYRNEAVMRYILSILVRDSSQAVRAGVLRALVHFVGTVGINGEYRGGRIDPMRQRQQALARKSIRTAVPLLRTTLGLLTPLQSGIWEVLGDFHTGVHARRQLLELCELLYEPKASLIVKMRTPPMYELSMRRRRDFVMVARFRSILKKRKHAADQEDAEAAITIPKQEPPKLKLKLR